MTRRILTAAGCLATVAAMGTGTAFGQDERVLQRLDTGIEVSPIAIARAVIGADGPRMIGDWMPYGGQGQRDERVMVFDCFSDADDCATGRYFFGSSFSNLFVTNDMTVAAETVLDAGASRADFAWFWTAGGSGTSEACIVGLFTQESVPCDDDSFDYSGWLLDFGTLPSSVGLGYYVTNVDIVSTGVWPLPTTGTGSYVEIFASEVTTSGAFVMATLAQPMLWGTGDARGDPDAPGTQGPLQFDEVTGDLEHTISECFSYSTTDICPNVLGAMMGFWGYRGDGCLDGFANCNGDDAVNSQDFLCFLGLWAAGDLAADCTGDGEINSQDFLCFLGLWAGCA